MSSLANPDELHDLSNEDFLKLCRQVNQLQDLDKKENQLYYYEPVSKESAGIHRSNTRTCATFGGNGSSKTETNLVEIIICATGIIPASLKGIFDESKIRGPINCRVVCESLTTVLHPIILPKLQWWRWTGVDEPGGERGHWGWIPRTNLIQGKWEKSWSEKLRMLRLIYRDPVNPAKTSESTIQFMSVDQDPTDFASGDFHIVLHDEPPSYAIWRENQARTMRVRGRMLLAMTWPDDPSIPVDWIFDEIYDKGAPGPNKDPTVEWINLYTTDNKHLDQDAVREQMGAWTDEVTRVRILGGAIRFSNRIHPNFTDTPLYWCHKCGKTTLPLDDKCGTCANTEIMEFIHIVEDEPDNRYPTIFALDPHPRKPHMMIWVQIDPSDDLLQVAEAEVEGDPVEVKLMADEVESQLNLQVTKRLIDPNMGASPSGAKRGVTWQNEFDSAGLYCSLADDSDVGRSRINEYLKPDKARGMPRIRMRTTCPNTIHQFKRYVWDDFRMKLEKELKQTAKMKYDDYPTMWKYIMNSDPTFNFLSGDAPTLRRLRGRKH